MQPRTTAGTPSRIKSQRQPAMPNQWTESRIHVETGAPTIMEMESAVMRRATAFARSRSRNQYVR